MGKMCVKPERHAPPTDLQQGAGAGSDVWGATTGKGGGQRGQKQGKGREGKGRGRSIHALASEDGVDGTIDNSASSFVSARPPRSSLTHALREKNDDAPLLLPPIAVLLCSLPATRDRSRTLAHNGG
jgi:hypothetical protein